MGMEEYIDSEEANHKWLFFLLSFPVCDGLFRQ
jgi:hypothetical protein